MQKIPFTDAFDWITGRKKSHYLTPAQKHCFPLLSCHTILTSPRKTPPSLCPPSFSNIAGQSWKSLSSLSPVFRSLSPYRCWWEGRVRQGAKQMSVPRMDSAPRGRGGRGLLVQPIYPGDPRRQGRDLFQRGINLSLASE